MSLIVDASFVYALLNRRESRHFDAVYFALTSTDEWLIPDVVFPELSYLFRRDFEYAGVQKFLELIQTIDVRYEPIIVEDIPRLREIAEIYDTAAFDIVDCCIMAIAERLDITRIATFDHRDFSIYRPRHCEFFELLPAE